MHQEFVSFFKSKGYTTKKSNTHELIEAFNKTKISKNLFDFLQIHPSFRVLFRAIIKTGEQAVDPDLIYSKMIDQFGKLDTSIIYSVQCNTCKKDIYSLNVAEKNFRIGVNDTLHCASCRRTIYNKSIQFHPVYEISKSDLIRYLNAISEKSGLSLSNIALSCIHCENTFNSIEDVSNVDLKCPTCGNTRYVIPIYFLEDEINKLIANKHGTVGIISGVDDLKSAGHFSMRVLKEWIEKVGVMYGDDDVEIYFKASEGAMCNAYMIAASATDSDEIFVAATGKTMV